MNRNDVFIIGGGAAGIVAAISAKRLGANVTILEQNPRIGKKILATGNGRCNYTNLNTDVTYYSGNNPKFVHSALAQFGVDDTLNFFEKLGITPKIEDFGKVFPMSEQASSIIDVFLYELNELGVNIICETLVKSVTKEGAKFLIRAENDQIYKADKVIITAGGKAMPSSGSDGNGYNLAFNLGHEATDIFPALVQLMLEGPYFKHLAGVKFVGTAAVLHKGKIVAQDRGDILFANYGISGPPILQVSRQAGALLQAGEFPELKITIIDTIPPDELKELIKKRINLNPHKPIDISLIGLINKRLISVILKEAKISNVKLPVNQLSNKELEKLVEILTDFRFKIKGTKSWPSAQVTAGGISTTQINQDTMESKLHKGLYFAGEILDIDGQCGGFNLQWAWSSGYIAGQNAAFS